jgi:DNA-binding transcriptional MerR regulator
MDKHRAIPSGYMTVGQVAQRMKTTVRTLQYYHREGVLSPSAESEGGRRLYTDRDIIRLHQIQSMKYLGFSLEDIKIRLVNLETPEEVAAALASQAQELREKISSLSEALTVTEKLRDETLKMDSVNWKKYADIVVNLQMKNEYYGLIKHFDDKMLDHIRSRYDMESGQAAMNRFNELMERFTQLKLNGIVPESSQGQAAAQAFWDYVMEFTGGDMSQLPGLMRFGMNEDLANEEFMESWAKISDYVSQALGVYLEKLGVNPFEGV